jgi:hypothetical protein
MDVLLYSKFSNESKKLLDQLEKMPDVLSSISLLCIDNKEVRKRIMNDEKIKVKGVPCFIQLNDETGNYDIYEGDNATSFFKKIQQDIELQIVEKQRQEMEMERQRKEMELEQQRLEIERQRKELENEKQRKELEMNKHEETQRSILQQAKQQESMRHFETNKTVQFTPIEELDIEEEPKKMSSKGTSLLSKAAQLQKDRS